MLVLCSDHGMSETGSHGASSMEEVNTPLILISSAFERKPGENLGIFNILKLFHFSFFCSLIIILKTIFWKLVYVCNILSVVRMTVNGTRDSHSLELVFAYMN